MILELACKNVKVFIFTVVPKKLLYENFKTYFPFVTLSELLLIQMLLLAFVCHFYESFFGKLKKEEVAISHRQVCSKNLKVFSGFLFTTA